MSGTEHCQPTDAAPLWVALLTTRQRRLLEVCVVWHARVHADACQRREFAALAEVLHAVRPFSATLGTPASSQEKIDSGPVRMPEPGYERRSIRRQHFTNRRSVG